MQLKHLQHFICLAEIEHMTKAAQLLNTSQPNVSYSINELEKELQLPLFEKKGRNISLTKYGKIYYQFAKEAVKALENGKFHLEQELQPDSGFIHFGFLYTLGANIVPKLTKQFSKNYPKVSFEFTQSNTKSLLEKVTNGSLDLALSASLDEFNDLEFTPFCSESLVAVLPYEHPLAAQATVSLKDLSNENFVYFDQHSGLRPFLDKLWQKQGLTINPVIEVEEDHTMLGFVANGYGVAIIPDIPSIAAYNVQKRPISDDFKKRQLYIVTKKNSFLPPIMKTFIQFLQNHKS
ncbi:LysR family transcriptional regulator [Streptococcus halotolerans]|uniref:LysR family transcriptional regulator n=1 Tax=Streptococcus halotolerans TaxID=1814128 RepID=UPI000787625A|nr:LysR family transcriptional regulator [Streptococcus halotolerans]